MRTQNAKAEEKMPHFLPTDLFQNEFSKEKFLMHVG